MNAKTVAASSADLQIGPTLSRLQLKVMAPLLLMLPKVGLSPVAPQVWLGEMIDPCVSVPMAKGTNPATVAELEPADEPLEPLSRFHGFFVLPPNQ